MVQGTVPTAEGDLERTPFAHLLVYAIERHLTGALFLTEPSGTEHVVRLAEGAAVKVRPGDGHARLGQLLIESGAITEQALEGALSMKGLLGDALVLAGCIDEATLEQAVEEQFMRRMVRLFGLPAATKYRYFDGHCALGDDAAEPASTDPLAVLWAGLRQHGHLSTRIDALLARLGSTALHFHPAAAFCRFGFGPEERAVIHRIREQHESFPELVASEIAPAGMLRCLVYALLITRQLDLGSDVLPLGTDTRSMQPATTAGRGLALARLRLRATAHRMGAAAPDLPGDGVRGPVSVRTRRRSAPPRSSRPRSVPPPAASRPSGAEDLARSSSMPPERVSSPPERVSSPPERVSSPPERVSSPPERVSSPPERVSSPPRRSSAPPERVSSPPGRSSSPPGRSSSPPGRSSAPPERSSGVVPTLAQSAAASSGISRFAVPTIPRSGVMLFELAAARLADGDLYGALDACAVAREAGSDIPDCAALSAWLRAMLPNADNKALAAELDEILAAHQGHIAARYYRGVLRGRLGEIDEAIDDLRGVVDADPSHAEALRELRDLEGRKPSKPLGLLRRWLKR